MRPTEEGGQSAIGGGASYRRGGPIRYRRGCVLLTRGANLPSEGVRPTEEIHIRHRRGYGLPRRSISAIGGGTAYRGGGQSSISAIGGGAASRGDLYPLSEGVRSDLPRRGPISHRTGCGLLWRGPNLPSEPEGVRSTHEGVAMPRRRGVERCA